MPRFDLVLLGVGADGHAASLFPGSAALEEATRLVVANFVDSLSAWRITLTFPVFEAAERVLFLAAGGEKAPIVRAATVKRPVASTPPAGRVRPRGGVLSWLIDRAAAAHLEGGEGVRASAPAG
jgi:6-phosphogluconolactonase